MNKQLTKKTIGIAASAALMASMALSGSALAGQGNGQGPKGDRDPSTKECPNSPVYTACSYELDAAWTLVGVLIGNNENVRTFKSRNPERDAGTLQCKITGAEIKVSQDKNYEASDLMQQALDKIWSLYAQGKLSYAGLTDMENSFNAAKDCIDGL